MEEQLSHKSMADDITEKSTEEEIELGPNGSVMDNSTTSHDLEKNRCDEQGDDGDDTTSVESEAEEDTTNSPITELQPDVILPIPDLHGNPVHFPEEDDQQCEENKAIQGVGPKKSWRYYFTAIVDSIKYTYSTCLLLFSVIVVTAAIFTKQTTGTAENGIPTWAAFIIFWLLILWLAMMEGGQGALVGLQPVEKELYAESHPRALKCTTLVHKGQNMERFIIGRQFLVVLVLFISNLVSSAISGASVLGLPEGVNNVFLKSGVAVILTTIMLGQLPAQVNAANCMLDFINNYFMLFTEYISLFIEFSGLLHCVYLVQIFFASYASRARNPCQRVFFWFRILVSFTILGFAFAVTLSALFQGKTTAWDGVPSAVLVIIFFVLMCFVGIMEGMQIALFAVVNMPEAEIEDAAVAKANCELAFRGHNLQAFLIGRQICVTMCTFVIARISTLDIQPGTGENIFGVSDGLQEFFNTGLLGALITTIVASLAWRIIASSFPLAFLSNPLIYLIIRLCLLLEASGLCSASWLIAIALKTIFRFKPDVAYIGTRSESAPDDNGIDEEAQTHSLALEEEMKVPESQQ